MLKFTTGKQCYHCQGLGHVQADCPTLRLSGTGNSGRCYSCGNTGHLARNCPAGSMVVRTAPAVRGGYNPGFGRGNYGGPRPATCYKCGGIANLVALSCHVLTGCKGQITLLGIARLRQ